MFLLSPTWPRECRSFRKGQGNTQEVRRALWALLVDRGWERRWPVKMNFFTAPELPTKERFVETIAKVMALAGGPRARRLCGEFGGLSSGQRLDLHHQRHDRSLNLHRSGSRSRGMAQLYRDRSLGQVRLCDKFRLERRLDVQHQPNHGNLNVHRDNSCGTRSYLNRRPSVRKVCVCDECTASIPPPGP